MKERTIGKKSVNLIHKSINISIVLSLSEVSLMDQLQKSAPEIVPRLSRRGYLPSLEAKESECQGI